MSDAEQIAILTEIRELQRRQIELTQRSLDNQAESLKNQAQSLERQKAAIDRQISNQEILIKARKWTRILLGLLVVAAFLYLLQPAAVFLWFWTHAHQPIQ